MIHYGSFKDINSEYDEVWLIVRSLKSMPKGNNIIHVPVLSPSLELFQDYMDWKSHGLWNKDMFENQYKPRFLKEMEFPECVEMLETLKRKGKENNILLVCYCEDESICHRSIIKELIEKKCTLNDFYLLIAGSRDYTNYVEMSKITDVMLTNHKQDKIHIVCGGANGADMLAKRYAKENRYLYHEFKADWEHHSKSAEYKRNREMHEFIKDSNARGCLCFWDGQSKETAQNFELSKEMDTPLKVFDYTKKMWVSQTVPSGLI